MRPVAILLVAALAGCATPAGEPFAADWSQRALAAGGAHDHDDRAHHRGLSTPNFEVIGWSPLDGGVKDRTLMGNLCGDAVATEDGRRIAIVTSREEMAFTLADVTDPAAPRWIGELALPGVRTYDVAAVPDGKHVVFVTSEVHDYGPGHGPGPLAWRRACSDAWTSLSGPEHASSRATLYLVDITTPEEPRVVQTIPLPGFGHGVSSSILDGRALVGVATVCAPTPRGLPAPPPPEPVSDNVPSCSASFQTYSFYEVADVGGQSRLALLSTMTLPTQSVDEVRFLSSGHSDVWMSVHPVTGRPTAWLVGASAGFWTVDLSDPRRPQVLGSWNDHDLARPRDTGNIHSVFAMPETWDGRHYTLIGPEFGVKPEALPTGVTWVLDTTDPAQPREVAAWTLPHDVEWPADEEYLFSPHYMTAVGRTAFVSMYHGGVWAVDLSQVGRDAFVSLPSVGVFLPDRDPPFPPDAPFRWNPAVEDVLAMPDGSLVTFDDASGLYALRFDEGRPAPAPAPWPLRALS